MRVQDILRANNAKLVVISPDVSIRQAAAMIADEQVGMLLVVDARGVLVGLLSERDIVRFIAARGNDALASGVSAAMAEIGLIVSPEDPVADVMRQMANQRARHLPVVSEHKLVGVISIGDILNSRLAEKDQEAAVLRDIARGSLVAAA
ncbi:CBS domain-containing protein [Bradyrhizobium erythrophlei]|nr:CBS domain-containing protein [Bradyrhizobium erythrophlei]